MIFPLAEIYAFTVFVQKYGFLNGLATLIISGILGVFVMKSVGRAIVSDFQMSLSQGQLPPSRTLHRTVVVVGGLLLMIPGLISDLFGLLCILPGTRHLIVLYIKFMFAKGLFRATKGFTFVFNGQNFGSRASTDTNFRAERDAKIIDVTPLEVTHTQKEEPSNSN